jgi:SAM-dependent methyltransferase
LSQPRVFDRPLQSETRIAREDFLRRVLPPWQAALGLRNALDIGCGVGYFSAMLRDLQFQVTAVDARSENIAEAQKRHPGINFRVADAEDLGPASLGVFDLVLCFGLLYHLENPLRGMRNWRALTGKLLLLESMMVEDEQPFLLLRDEPAGDDQSLRAVSCYPSEGAIIKMAYRAGFPHVYRFRQLPDHEDFRAGVGRARARTVIAASVPALDSAGLLSATEPKPSGDLWTTDPTGITNALRRIRRNLRHSRTRKRS